MELNFSKNRINPQNRTFFSKKTSKNRTMHRPHRRKSVKIVRFRFRVEKPHTAHSQIANAALTLKERENLKIKSPWARYPTKKRSISKFNPAKKKRSISEFNSFHFFPSTTHWFFICSTRMVKRVSWAFWLSTQVCLCQLFGHEKLEDKPRDPDESLGTFRI